MARKKPARDSREDARLVRACLRGDDEAFTELVARYQDPVYNVVYRMVGDREDARDLAQEAFVRAYEGLEGFDDQLPFSAWLYRIGTNAAIDHLRRRSRRPLPLDQAFGNGDAEPGDPDDFFGPDRHGLPEDVSISNEVSRIVRGAVLGLPANYRAVVVLHHLEELTYAEVGRVLGIPKNTAKTWARRARTMLCDSLEGVI